MVKLIYTLPVVLVLTAVFIPSIWVNICVLVDFYTPWTLFESAWYERYHAFITKGLPDLPEQPLPEILASEATRENVLRLTQGYTFPLVIRGLLVNSTSVQKWGDHEWWTERYGQEDLLCGTFSHVMENCTVQAFFDGIRAGTPFYVAGASVIFDRHPELHEMIDNEAIRSLEPAPRMASQVFMGLPGMGSDIHCAAGVNLFRMITGRKKWWFVPPGQTSYLKPSINVNGFSAHSQTLIGKPPMEPSPWLKKLLRYTTIIGPGDVLINPPWFWHGILNLGEPGDLVIGSPTRYGRGAASTAAFKLNPLYSINTMVTSFRKNGIVASLTGKVNLQTAIAANRKGRSKDAADEKE